MSGMVNVPVVTTFATGEPEMQPISRLDTIAVLAGPPLRLPVSEYAMSMNICPPLHAFRNAPNRTNRTINVLLMLIALPNTPFSE